MTSEEREEEWRRNRGRRRKGPAEGGEEEEEAAEEKEREEERRCYDDRVCGAYGDISSYTWSGAECVARRERWNERVEHA